MVRLLAAGGTGGSSTVPGWWIAHSQDP
uniref:Uncharacterized protein n=1 Tax=Arundo donax TaxID=35708 RepID=A0A0A8YWC2_ARUDO